MIGTWRQQQALETCRDLLASGPGDQAPEDFTASIIADTVEIATTVKITQDALDEFGKATGRTVGLTSQAGLVAFLTALGFEVVE